MHMIFLGDNADYVYLEAKPGGHLVLKDGRRYTFDVIDMPYYSCDALDRNNNLIEVERLSYGAGKWMLGSESFVKDDSVAALQLRSLGLGEDVSSRRADACGRDA